MGLGAGLMRADRRHQRAMVLFAEVFRIVGPHLAPDADERRLHDEIIDLFRREGVEVLTDTMRAEIGLAPRDAMGWTIEEIVALERAWLEAIARPVPRFMKAPT